jgi:hypothetical protein
MAHIQKMCPFKGEECTSNCALYVPTPDEKTSGCALYLTAWKLLNISSDVDKIMNKVVHPGE